MSGDELPILSQWGGESSRKGLAVLLTSVQRIENVQRDLRVESERQTPVPAFTVNC